MSRCAPKELVELRGKFQRCVVISPCVVAGCRVSSGCLLPCQVLARAAVGASRLARTAG